VRKVLAIIRREFVERVRTKWFWVGTILGPLLMVGIIGFQMLLARKAGGERHIAVVDATTTGFGGRVVAQLAVALPRFHPTHVPRSMASDSTLMRQVEQQQLDGFLLVSDSLLDYGVAEYRGSNVSSMADMAELQGTLQRLVFAARLERRGIDTLVVKQAQIPLRLDQHKVQGHKLTGESGTQSFWTGFGMAVLLFTAILIYGVNVMSSVLEEKTTRVVELLISSLRPFQLMLGKVVGAGAVGIVQLSVWIVSAKILAGGHRGLAGTTATGFQFPSIPTATLVIFVLYFLLGYFLYAAIYAAVGAMSSTESEARQAQVPVQLVLMVPYLAFFAILNDPNSSLAVWMTLIPFWSPLATPVRWGATPIPVVEMVASIGFLVAAVLVVTWLAARIYRVGILMTGKRPNLKEMVRWIRAG